jgi:hypothetical protein
MGITLAKQDGKLMEEYGLLSPYSYTISIPGERKSIPGPNCEFQQINESFLVFVFGPGVRLWWVG